MATVVTRRVSGTAAGGQTARISGVAAGGSTQRVSGAAAGGQTARVSSQATGGITSRIVPNFFLLEGDEDGFMLLEGDMQTGDDLLKLEGDEAIAVGGTTTRRIA